jgi:hypothetical protein
VAVRSGWALGAVGAQSPTVLASPGGLFGPFGTVEPAPGEAVGGVMRFCGHPGWGWAGRCRAGLGLVVFDIRRLSRLLR